MKHATADRMTSSNVIFGGVDGSTLYITCDKKVYSLAMNVKGAQFR